ncbi:uncharacterized protein LOC121384249 isoform X1 [Gigantopelta aegis]|uniref:uncharacterized protein LOC121384249 isoform X1 n=1 Tax=Gigantopelta aegis TaxID=1735272 RepID=UPI001B88E4C7|nr:uncharacterized protein LOC121384249 isoform X1 [Gigantopelta aegis]
MFINIKYLCMDLILSNDDIQLLFCSNISCKCCVDRSGPNPHCVGRGGEVFTIGEEKVTDDCFKCSCSYWGLNCCGVGPYNRGSMRLRPGCHVVPGKNCDFSIDCEDE